MNFLLWHLVIHKRLSSLVHKEVLLSDVFSVPSHVLGTSMTPPFAKTEQIALSLSLLKKRCHFWIQLPTDMSETEVILCLWKQMIWKWKRGKWAKRKSIYHTWKKCDRERMHPSLSDCWLHWCVCVYLCVMLWDNVAVRGDNVASPAKPSALWLQRKCVVQRSSVFNGWWWCMDGDRKKPLDSLLMERQNS